VLALGLIAAACVRHWTGYSRTHAEVLIHSTPGEQEPV
jgi:hypothetical protein